MNRRIIYRVENLLYSEFMIRSILGPGSYLRSFFEVHGKILRRITSLWIKIEKRLSYELPQQIRQEKNKATRFNPPKCQVKDINY